MILIQILKLVATENSTEIEEMLPQPLPLASPERSAIDQTHFNVSQN